MLHSDILLTGPDILIDRSIFIIWIVVVFRASVGADIRGSEEVSGHHIAAVLLLVERAISLVDDLPAMESQWLGDCGFLILFLPDALERGRAAVARRN